VNCRTNRCGSNQQILRIGHLVDDGPRAAGISAEPGTFGERLRSPQAVQARHRSET
jgi:hypothetical protein